MKIFIQKNKIKEIRVIRTHQEIHEFVKIKKCPHPPRGAPLFFKWWGTRGGGVTSFSRVWEVIWQIGSLSSQEANSFGVFM